MKTRKMMALFMAASMMTSLAPAALAEEAAERFGTVSEDHTVDVVGIVFPLTRLGITTTIVDGNAEGQDLGPSLRRAHFGITRKVSGDVYPVDAHSAHYLSSAGLTCGSMLTP